MCSFWAYFSRCIFLKYAAANGFGSFLHNGKGMIIEHSKKIFHCLSVLAKARSACNAGFTLRMHAACMQAAHDCMQRRRPACSLHCARKILREQTCSFLAYFSMCIFVWNRLSQMGLVLACMMYAGCMRAYAACITPVYILHTSVCILLRAGCITAVCRLHASVMQSALRPHAGCISAYAGYITPVCRLHASLCSLHTAVMQPACRLHAYVLWTRFNMVQYTKNVWHIEPNYLVHMTKHLVTSTK